MRSHLTPLLRAPQDLPAVDLDHVRLRWPAKRLAHRYGLRPSTAGAIAEIVYAGSAR